MLSRTVGFLLLAASVSTSTPSVLSPSSVTDLLERYDRGDYEAVTAAFERDSDASVREFRAALNRQMPEGSIPRMSDPLPLPDQFAADAKRWIRAAQPNIGVSSPGRAPRLRMRAACNLRSPSRRWREVSGRPD